MSSRTIFLHVGNFKTGTSALQQFCSTQRDTLLRAGLDYPDVARPGNLPVSHGKLPLSLYTRYGQRPPDWYADSDDYVDVAAALRRALEQSQAPAALVSSEEFYRVPGFPEEAREGIGRDLQALFAGYRVRVIMYVRAPLSFAISWYNEINKSDRPHRRFVDFVDHLNRSIILPEANTAYWRGLFGEDAVLLEPYGLRGEAHITRFLQLLGADGIHAHEAASAVVNPGRDETTLERDRLRKINALADERARSRLLRSTALASVEHVQVLQEKLEAIERDFQAFCRREQLHVPGEPLDLARVLVHDEQVNRRDVVSVDPLGVALLRWRRGAFAGGLRRLRARLAAWRRG
ncbi:hypothetical protein E4634_13195 [Mangrovimicrobium sediminis]|uniref:Sulfotransferase family protein n=1 Tax=Mangrovimicrobium sediminis TaxID=2562682 RepID=A0A4Z0LZ39_9GAMM|nr:hypothetical protein [Haliea sp. SAOS-164]TGD72484.1 hypothetical protein E4634_13195 [Haliea sp. SAOS-164]